MPNLWEFFLESMGIIEVFSRTVEMSSTQSTETRLKCHA